MSFDFGGLFDAAEGAMKKAKKNVKKSVVVANPKAKGNSVRRGRSSNSGSSPYRVRSRSAAQNQSRNSGGSGGGASYNSPGQVTQPSGRLGRLGRSGGTGNASRIAAQSAAPAAPAMPSEKDWLAGDSTYQDQNSEYQRALQEFIARISEREGEIKEDANLALAANTRNRTTGLNNNAEDFASRGMINSGLFADESEKMSDRYNESQGAIETNQSRGLGSLADERSNYEREVELGRNNARRSALQRMAAQFGTL